MVPHPLELIGEPGAVLTGPMTLSSGSGLCNRRGVLRQLRVEHFCERRGLSSCTVVALLRRVLLGKTLHVTCALCVCVLYVGVADETAVTLQGGRWRFDMCDIVSSRAPSRACAAVVLRGYSEVQAVGCNITGCSSAVLLSSAHARFSARQCNFANTRAAIAAERGACLDVRECVFSISQHDAGLVKPLRLEPRAADPKTLTLLYLVVCFVTSSSHFLLWCWQRLAPDTTGIICRNDVRGDGNLWGRDIPPASVRAEDSEDVAVALDTAD